jgi:RNA polymerase sigma-70 factor (ECF subfamily)
MDRYADGDEDAFGQLYDALAPRLTSFLSRSLRDPARVADLVQDTMLRMHCARGRFVRGSPVTPWAFTIARRLLLDGARRKKFEQLSSGEAETERSSDEPPPDEVVGSLQQSRAILQAVSQLPDTQRAAFELVHYGELTYAEAAETLRITVAGVKLRVHRANSTIRRTCAQEGTI